LFPSNKPPEKGITSPSKNQSDKIPSNSRYPKTLNKIFGGQAITPSGSPEESITILTTRNLETILIMIYFKMEKI